MQASTKSQIAVWIGLKRDTQDHSAWPDQALFAIISKLYEAGLKENRISMCTSVLTYWLMQQTSRSTQ